MGLRGQNVLARGCQADWADTLDVCEDVIKRPDGAQAREYLKSLFGRACRAWALEYPVARLDSVRVCRRTL